MKTSTLVGGSVLTSLVGGMSQLVGVPWGAVLTIIIIGLFLTFILGLAQLALPQDSRDKVRLWERVLEYRERRHTTKPAKKTRRHRDVGVAAKRDATVVALPPPAAAHPDQ